MSKKNAVEISKVNIRIGDKEIELSLDEAKELRSILNDTFGEKVTPIIVDRPYPVYPPVYPYRYWTVTIGDVPSYGTITSGDSNQNIPCGTLYLSNSN